jgi:Holliday junction resolvasome RuvABC endonuclease subunit
VADLTVIGIDPGKLRGTGIACCRLGRRRELAWSGSSVYTTAETMTACAPELAGGAIVCIETMAAMGPTRGMQKAFDNAQFVGEIVGRLEAFGARVIQLKKLEILRGLGIKGKASATRVRQVVGAILGLKLTSRFSDHEVDAMAVAIVGARRVATVNVWRREDERMGRKVAT